MVKQMKTLKSMENTPVTSKSKHLFRQLHPRKSQTHPEVHVKNARMSHSQKTRAKQTFFVSDSARVFDTRKLGDDHRVFNKLEVFGTETITAAAVSRDGKKIVFAALQKEGKSSQKSEKCDSTKQFPLVLVSVNLKHDNVKYCWNASNSQEKQTEGCILEDEFHPNFEDTEECLTSEEAYTTDKGHYVQDLINGIDFDQEGLQVAVCANKGIIQVYDIKNKKLQEKDVGIAKLSCDLLSVSYFKHKEGFHYLACSDNFEGIHVWRLKSEALGSNIAEKIMELTFPGDKIAGIVLLPNPDPAMNTKMMLAAASKKGVLYMNNVFSGADGENSYNEKLKLTKKLDTISRSDDGKTIALGGPSYLSILRYNKIEGSTDIELSPWEESNFNHEYGEITSVSLSGDGLNLFAGTGSRTAKLFDVETGAQLHEIMRTARVKTVALSYSGTFGIVGGFDGKVVRYNLKGGLDFTHVFDSFVPSDIFAVSLSADGKNLLCCSDREVTVYSLESDRIKARFFRESKVYCGQLTSRSEFAIAGGYDKKVMFYNVQTQQEHEPWRLEQNDFIWGLSLCQRKNDPKEFLRVAIGCWDGSASVYSIQQFESGEKPLCINKFQLTDRVFSTSLSADGEVLAVGTRGCEVALYNVTQVEQAAFLSWTCSDRVYCVAISHSGSMIAVGEFDKKVSIFDKHTRSRSHFWDRGGVVHDVQWGPEDKVLAAVGEDLRLEVYDVQSSAIVLQLPLNGIGYSLSICARSGAFACAGGKTAAVYGDLSHGYGIRDRPSFDLTCGLVDACDKLQDEEPLKILIGTYPTLVNARSPRDKRTILHYAVTDKLVEVVQILINGKVALGLLKDQNMQNALQMVAEMKNKQLLQLLFEGVCEGRVVGTDSVECLSVRGTGKDTTLLEEIGELFPDLILQLFKDYRIERCEPFVVGLPAQAPITKPKLAGHPCRSPREFWHTYFGYPNWTIDSVSFGQKIWRIIFQDDFDFGNKNEISVEAFRIPIKNICGEIKKTSEVKWCGITRILTKFCCRLMGTKTSPCYTAPLEVIVKAAIAQEDFRVFRDDTIPTWIVEFKWSILKRQFQFQSVRYVIHLILVSFFVDAIADTREIHDMLELKESHHGQAGIILGTLSAISSLWFFREKWIQFQNDGYLKNTWNLIGMGMFSLQFCVCFLFWKRNEHVCFVAAVAIIFQYFELMNYGIGWDNMGPLIRLITRMTADLKNFLFILLIVIMGFSLSFKLLEGGISEWFETFPFSFLQVTRLLHGDMLNFEEQFDDAQNRILTMIFWEVFMAIVVILLLNLLIALMNDTFAKVTKFQKEEQRLQLAKAILQFEQKSFDAKLFPAWLHILKPALSKRAKKKLEIQNNFARLYSGTDTRAEGTDAQTLLLKDLSLKLNELKVEFGRHLQGASGKPGPHVPSNNEVLCFNCHKRFVKL